MSRLVATFLAASLFLAPVPALAGASEDAFLARLVGQWSGSGALSGVEAGKLTCTATFRESGGGINFRVKCDVPKYGNQNFSGTISYNGTKKRYEAKSASGEVTVGTKSGNAVIFDAKMKGLAVGTSVMKLTASRITVDTKVKRPAASGEIKSHMELTKS